MLAEQRCMRKVRMQSKQGVCRGAPGTISHACLCARVRACVCDWGSMRPALTRSSEGHSTLPSKASRTD
eukprot:4128670-Pleurochrysis_carterae.AAC.1